MHARFGCVGARSSPSSLGSSIPAPVPAASLMLPSSDPDVVSATIIIL